MGLLDCGAGVDPAGSLRVSRKAKTKGRAVALPFVVDVYVLART
jgi:hypothetical protein